MASSAPTGPPTEEERAETRRAVWLVAACAAVTMLVYSIVAGVMTDDAYLTRLGRVKEIHFLQVDIRDMDREATYGDDPITWVLGSSITREAFDAESIEAELRAAGSEHRVVKLAFNRGAPVFSKTMLDDLPVRPGDRVVTTLAEDNFKRDWMGNSAGYTLYVQSLLSPAEIMALEEESFAARLEWSLSAVPPTYFARNREAYRRGLLIHLGNTFGVIDRAPKERARSHPFTNTNTSRPKPKRKLWEVAPDELRLEPGQPNFDAFEIFKQTVADRGAELLVVYVPSRPMLYEDMLDPSVVNRFHDHFDATLPEFHRLRPRVAEAYIDVKHVNNLGRRGFSRDLVEVLLEDEGLPVPERIPDPYIAPVTPLTERIWQGVGR